MKMVLYVYFDRLLSSEFRIFLFIFQSHIPIRADPHILIVGDPGLGKSQLLHACVSVAPRGK